MEKLSIETLISIALAALTLILIFVGHYFYVRGKLHKAVAGAISNAEQEGKTGEEKLAMAVEQVYSLIPTLLKVIIHKSSVRKIVQAAFDKIEDYAKKQVEKKLKKEEEESLADDKSEKISESQPERAVDWQQAEPLLHPDEKTEYVNCCSSEHSQSESENAIQWYLI